MELGSLLQTLVFMNMKDMSNFTLRQLAPYVLMSIIFTYKDKILEVLSSKIFGWRRIHKYKSQIINEVKLGDDNNVYTRSSHFSCLIWYYRRTNSAINASKEIKAFMLRASVEVDPEQQNFSPFKIDCLIPSSNTTVPLTEDIDLEFLYDISLNKKETNDDNNKNSKVKEETKFTFVKLICKSKSLSLIELDEWIQQLHKKYWKWKEEAAGGLSLYMTYTKLDGQKDLLINQFKYSSTKSFSNMFFEQKESIIQRLEEYTQAEKYKKLGIPHTLGFMFYGQPGCGKTSCIKAIANYTNRNIVSINLEHIVDINQLRNLILGSYLGGLVVPPEKRLYVFEEIDCNSTNKKDNPFLRRDLQDDAKHPSSSNHVSGNNAVELLTAALVKDKDNSESFLLKPKISTGDILELLDGITETTDRMAIFTTNHIDKIDPAFLRPGRIDMVVEFKKLRRQDINNLYKLWFNKPLSAKVYDKIKDYTISQADFGKLCFENNAEKVVEKLLAV
jgi:hypothetical protein